MKKKITQDELNKIVELHKKWLNTEKEGKLAILDNMDLYRLNLCGADLRYAKCRGTNFKRANLVGVNFANADLSNSNLANANLCCAYMAYAKVDKANFDGADFYRIAAFGVDFTNSINMGTVANFNNMELANWVDREAFVHGDMKTKIKLVSGK